MTSTFDASLLDPASLLIFCDGGFANRVNSLLNGLVLARHLGLRHKILWPRNNRCGAGFGEIFAMPELVHDLVHDAVHEVRLQDLVPHQSALTLWLHENDVGFTVPVANLRSLAGLSSLPDAGAGRAILFCENALLPWLAPADLAWALHRLQWRDHIVASARAVLGRLGGPGFIGIHLRATDFTSPPPTDAMFAAVQRLANGRFFVCSDDAALEARFATESNVVVHHKSAHVEKRVAGPWRGAVQDSDGLPYTSNIERGARSVVEACVDLLLLAVSTPVRTSGSSFLALAERLKAAGALPAALLAAAPAVAPATAPAAVTQQQVLDLLQGLRPRQMVTDHKLRIGADGDGGYVMPSLARQSNAVLSIGIGDQVSFDAELADLGATVLQYDHTIPGQPMAHANFRFHALGWGPVDDGLLRCTRSMMAGIDWAQARHAILKFDTEGAEWDALAHTASADLARFDVIAGEFHGFHNLAVPSVYKRIREVMDKLALTHVPVHLHANNATGIRLVLGVPVPPLLEITFVRKGVVVTAGPCNDPIPGPLDRPNMADRPDICLRPF